MRTVFFEYRGYHVFVDFDSNVPYGAWRLFTKPPGDFYATQHGLLEVANVAPADEVRVAAEKAVDALFTAQVLKEN